MDYCLMLAFHEPCCRWGRGQYNLYWELAISVGPTETCNHGSTLQAYKRSQNDRQVSLFLDSTLSTNHKSKSKAPSREVGSYKIQKFIRRCMSLKKDGGDAEPTASQCEKISSVEEIKKPFSFIDAVLSKPPPGSEQPNTPVQNKDVKVAKPQFSHKCKHGYATEDSRRLWLQQRGFSGEETDKVSKSLEASTDPKRPIFFWQLFSVLGPDRIYAIVRRFYENVFADTEDKFFRDVFRQISDVEHHTLVQTAFWIDAMGGGRRYHGGWYRLSFHHDYNAHQIMTKDGAVRWMYHMNRALDVCDLTEDPRVKASIVDFLKTHMDKYAEQFHFDTDGIEYGVKPSDANKSQDGSDLAIDQ